MACFVGTTILHGRGAARSLNLFRDYPVDEARKPVENPTECPKRVFCGSRVSGGSL
jgi:hypothetical protein